MYFILFGEIIVISIRFTLHVYTSCRNATSSKSLPGRTKNNKDTCIVGEGVHLSSGCAEKTSLIHVISGNVTDNAYSFCSAELVNQHFETK